MEQLEELKVLINAELTPFKTEIKKMQQTIQSATKVVDRETTKIGNSFKKMTGFVKGALIGLGLFQFGKEAIEMASSIDEVQNVIETAFGNMTPLVEKFSKTAIQEFGMSELAFKRTASTMMAMSKGMGFVGREAADMAISVTKLSGDMASFYNVKQDVAETALKSIWTGETETLKRFGVVMTQTNLQQFAMKNGMRANIQQMSQQEQLMLRYRFVMNSLSLAQGDFLRTQDSWANQTRILSEQFKQLLAIIGSGLIQALTPALRLINQLIAGMITFSKAIGGVFGKMFGLKSVSNQVKTPIQDIGSTGVKGLDNIGKSANKAAKSVKNLLAPFDELNVLADNTNTGAIEGLGNVGSVAPSFDISDIKMEGEIETSPLQTAIEKAINSIKPFIDTIMKIDFSPIAVSLGNLGNAIVPIIFKIGTVFKDFLNNIAGPFIKWFTEKIAPTALDAIAGALKILDPIIGATINAGKLLFDNFLAPLASFTAPIFENTLRVIAELLTHIGNWMSSNQPIIDAIVISVGLFFAAWKVTQLLAFISASGGIVAALTAIRTAIELGIVAKLKDNAETVILTALYAKDAVVKGISTAATWASTAATTAATVATTALSGALAILTSPITLVIAAIAGLVAAGVMLWKNWDTVKAVAANAWEGVKNIVVNTWNTIKNAIQSAWNFIIGLFSKGGQIFSGVVNGIAGVFKNIINAILRGINAIIRQPFNIINGVLNFIRDLGVMGIKPFAGLWGRNPIPVPQIPYLDVGTNYVAKDGLAYIHEGEAVVPKKFNKQEFFNTNNIELAELLKEQNNLIRSLLEKDNHVYLDGKEITDTNAKMQRQLEERMG